MSESSLKHTCDGKVWDGWRYHQCSKNAKVERNGKHYCGIHDPVARAEKNAAKESAYLAECAAKELAQATAKEARAEIERRAACYDELLEALKAAEDLYCVGLLSSASGQIERVVTLRKAAIAKAGATA